MEKEIITSMNTGMLKLSLNLPWMPKALPEMLWLVKINTRFEVVDKWYRGQVEKIDGDILARICYVLDCKPGDIIHYHCQKKKDTAESVNCISAVSSILRNIFSTLPV